MNNKFKIEQISTDQYVLRRHNISKTEYLTNTLDIIVLDSIGSHNEVVFNSLNTAITSLNTYNSKQLLNEMRQEMEPVKGLSIKSIKFKYKVNNDNGSEEVIGVDISRSN